MTISKKLQIIRSSCHILDQYGQFKVDDVGIYLNGINTQGENIADNGGIKQSFHVSALN